MLDDLSGHGTGGVHLVEPHLRGTALSRFAAFRDLAYDLTGPLAGRWPIARDTATRFWSEAWRQERVF